MRRPFLLLSVLTLVTAACSGSAGTLPPGAAAPPAHHQQTPRPAWPAEPATPRPVRPPEPGATPYGGVTYQDPGVNPYVPTERDRQSTFALDVDTASYAIARRYVDDGNLPDPASIRVEEFVNAFDQAYRAPEDQTFAIYADGAPSPFLEPDETLLRVGVKAREVRNRERPDAALTFVIDTSGSMGMEDRLGLVQDALSYLVDRLGARDSVAIVTYGSSARVVLPPTSVRQAGDIRDAIDGLRPDGSTNAEAGLALGYRLAADNLLEGGINRVILASDGVANVGNTDPADILRRISWDASLGIQLVSVGVGMGNYNDVLMEQLADQGDGFYAYLNTVDDARQLFGEKLTSTLDTVALDARVQVDFNPDLVEAYRLIGYENRALPDDSFRDDRVDAGAIGAGHASTALYALRLTGEGSRSERLATVSLRWTEPDTGRAIEIAQDVRAQDLASSFGRTPATFQLDALVAAAAEVLRASRWADGYSMRDVAAAADGIARDLPATDEAAAFLTFLDRAARLDR
jgi:Ca-activated chloride channel family protein